MELLEVEKEVICGKKITAFTIHGDEGPSKYLIGVQVSKILHRQTFNLYRSLKLKGVGVIRASPQQLGFLLRTQSLPPNSHSVSLIPYEGAKDFILGNFKGKIDEPTPTASKSARPSPTPTTNPFSTSSSHTPPPPPPPPPPSQQHSAAQLQKILQFQLKRAYGQHEYPAYFSGNESSFSSSSGALSSDSEADHLYHLRRPASPLSNSPPTYHSPVLPSDELKRYQRPTMMMLPPTTVLKQHYTEFISQKRGSSSEIETGEILASFFHRPQQQQQRPTTPIKAPIPPTPTMFSFPPLVAPPVPFPLHKLTLPPITFLPSASPTTTFPPLYATPITTTPKAQPVRNPKHNLSFVLEKEK